MTRASTSIPPTQASRSATVLGRAILRTAAYPGRRLVGTFHRKHSRRLGGRRFAVHTRDGERLDAWFSPRMEGRPARLPVVICHGWMQTKEAHFRQAWWLNRIGHDVVLFDHRMHGRSSGRVVTFSVREREDLADVIEAATQRNMLGPRFVTLGFSMGAATVLQHARQEPRVAGVVALAPFSDLLQAVDSFRKRILPFVGREWLLRGFEQAAIEAGFNTGQARTVEAMGEINVPILLIEGSRDRTLPPDRHTRLLAEARDDVQMFRVDQAGHCTLCRRPWPGLKRTIARFCRDAAREPDGSPADCQATVVAAP